MKSNKLIAITRLTAKIASALLAAFMLFLFVAESWGPQPQNTSPKRISVGSNYHLQLNDSIKGGKWHSGNPAIASVDSLSGVVKGTTVGSATITHTFSSGETSFAVDIITGPPKWKDAIGLTLMAIIWIGMVIVWWKEQLGAWLTFIGVTMGVTMISINNGSAHSVSLLIGALPAMVLIICSYAEKWKASAD